MQAHFRIHPAASVTSLKNVCDITISLYVLKVMLRALNLIFES